MGADSAGKPTGELTAAQAAQFDEARLRDILKKWIPLPPELLVSTHALDDGQSLVLIYVAPNPAGLSIFNADGQYPDAGNRSTTVFREGDVFVRDGTQSRRWQQPDIARIVSRMRSAEKERWLREVMPALRGIIAEGTAAQGLARGPASALTWRLDGASLEQVIVEQLRAGDLIPLQLMLDAVSADAAGLLRANKEDDFETLLDRLACLAVLFVRVERRELFDRVVVAFRGIYDLTFDQRGLDRQLGELNVADLRLAVIKRVMAVGAFAVRRGDWPSVRTLVLQRGAGRDFEGDNYTNWIRHAQVGATRAGL